MIESHWKMEYGYKPDCHLCQTEINDNIRDAIARNDKEFLKSNLEIARLAGIKVWVRIDEMLVKELCK